MTYLLMGFALLALVAWSVTRARRVAKHPNPRLWAYYAMWLVFGSVFAHASLREGFETLGWWSR